MITGLKSWATKEVAKAQTNDVRAALDTLREYEKRSLIHAVGLPAQAVSVGSWSGIGFVLAEANLVGEMDSIVEVMPMPVLTNVPGAKPWVLGIANVRGTLVPVVDLRGYLTGQRSAIDNRTRVLVTAQKEGVVGLLIDEVRGQRQFEREERASAGGFGDHLVAGYIRQEFEKDDERWGEFDLQRLVNSAEFLRAAV